MNKKACAAALILACATCWAVADDSSDKQAKTPWDIAFGSALMTDFNLRGLSVSDHRPAVMTYFEPRYDFSPSLQAYLDVSTYSITLPNHPPSSNEIFVGVRPTFDRLALDFGIWQHWLPGGRCFNFQTIGGLCIPQATVPYVNSVPADISFREAYAKATYYVDRQLSISGEVDWTPSVLNSGAEATYVSGRAKYILPPTLLPDDTGWYISAEAGHWYRDASPYPSYTNWNAGLAFTWKQFTLDLRYSDTDHHDCDQALAAARHDSNRCGASFVAKLAVNLNKANLTESGAGNSSGAAGNSDKDNQAKTPWDIAFGGALMSDYNFRGISASDHRPAVMAYFEPRYDFSTSLQAYTQVATKSITFPNHAADAVELFAGIRPTFDRLALDFGVWEHWLPGGRCFDSQTIGTVCPPSQQSVWSNPNIFPADVSYLEVFANATYYVDKRFSFGGRVDWTPSVLNTGAEATYVVGWAKYILPSVLPKDIGWFVSVEGGHWFRDASPYPSYSNWNAGLAFTWKQFTLDLRYSDTDRHDCIIAVLAANHTSNVCGESFVARLSFDMTKANLK
jgi:hypothetical protein